MKQPAPPAAPALAPLNEALLRKINELEAKLGEQKGCEKGDADKNNGESAKPVNKEKEKDVAGPNGSDKRLDDHLGSGSDEDESADDETKYITTQAGKVAALMYISFVTRIMFDR